MMVMIITIIIIIITIITIIIPQKNPKSKILFSRNEIYMA